MVTKKESENNLNGGYSTPGHKWQRAVFFLLLLTLDIFGSTKVFLQSQLTSGHKQQSRIF